MPAMRVPIRSPGEVGIRQDGHTPDGVTEPWTLNQKGSPALLVKALSNPGGTRAGVP